MKQLNNMEVKQISAAFKMNIGQAVAAMVFGIVTGGPVGLGYAVSVIIIAQGVNNLEEIIIEY